MVSIWKKKKWQASKFVDAGSRTGMRETGINNMERISREEWRKIKLGKDRRENIDTLHVK